MRDVPDVIPDWWEHPEDEMQWVRRDSSNDYVGVVNTNENVTLGAAVMVEERMLTKGVGESE